ncbi:tyrosine--tRNA ligase, cytoplasmic [Aspergillus avenaceus]|uniref:tyrosine--tRNA ligase n=1 Tax=Aspergillus avenaceus TaxID=36643 RepID=A0A5N6U1D7_ASPAV|nr:tyrosine--tRNA ligase, cytoplasmic [Aspergillus avenaceus]
MSSNLSIEEKYALVTRRMELQNGSTAQQLRELLLKDRPLRYLWDTAPTGKPHTGYFVPWVKLSDFLRAGGEVIVGLLDTYAFLMNYKHAWEEVQHRTTYYRHLITAVLTAMGIPMSNIKFEQESQHQGTPRYNVDLWKFCALASQSDVRATGAEVGAATLLGPLLTPIVQELLVEYFQADVEVGGTDQRGIYTLGQQFLPRLGYRVPAHLMNELLPSLVGGKMSSSAAQSTKIMFLDDAQTVQEKVARGVCHPGVVEGNGILPILEHILMPISELRWDSQSRSTQGDSGDVKWPFCAKDAPSGTLFSIPVRNVGCGCKAYRHYESYEALENDYKDGHVTPEILKDAVASALNELLEPVRQAYEGNGEWREADRMGYPEDWVGLHVA